MNDKDPTRCREAYIAFSYYHSWAKVGEYLGCTEQEAEALAKSYDSDGKMEWPPRLLEGPPPWESEYWRSLTGPIH